MGILKVQETRSHVHAPGEEEKVMTRKQKAESKAHEVEHSPKKAKVEKEDGQINGKSETGVAEEYDEFCKVTNEHLPLEQMREIMEANSLDSSGSDLEIARRWLVLVYIRPFESGFSSLICNDSITITTSFEQPRLAVLWCIGQMLGLQWEFGVRWKTLCLQRVLQ